MDSTMNMDTQYKASCYNSVKRTGNVASSLQLRERGIKSDNGICNRQVLEEAAEYRLVMKTYTERACELPGIPRSTFLMVFSPDGTMVASTHGNHDVYVSELATGKHVKTLTGHPRTPWCVSFHPSHSQLIASGCLGGQVRVWDLSGGSEVWTTRNETVIASIAFHPREQLLVIATYNELVFWNWAQPQPYIRIQTSSVKEKVRFVSFDSLGHKLITGISLRPTTEDQRLLCFQNEPFPNNNRDQNTPSPDDTEPLGRISEVHERIVTSYHNLVQRYDSLMRNYHRLFLSRSQTTTDRGTDPMDIDLSSSDGQGQRMLRNGFTRGRGRTTEYSGPWRRPYSRSLLMNRVNPLISGATSDNISDNSDSETGSNDHSLNLRSLSLENQNSGPSNSNIDNNPENSTDTSRVNPVGSNNAPTETLYRRSIFDSVLSAFQPMRSQGGSQGGTLDNPFNRPDPQVRGSATQSQNQSSNLRYIITNAVNHLHRYVESLIDETINFWERYDRMGRDPGLFQDFVLNDLAQHLHSHLEESERTVFSNVCRRSNVENCPMPNDNEENNSVVINSIVQSLRDIRNLATDAGPSILSLNSDTTNINSEEQERNPTRARRNNNQIRGWNVQNNEGFRGWNVQNQPVESRRPRQNTSSSRNELFSSEDSDSEWEMFRPLRVNIYRTRNWNADLDQADPTPNDNNFSGPFSPRRRIVLEGNSTSAEPSLNTTTTVTNNSPHVNDFDVRFSDGRFMIHSNNSNARSETITSQNDTQNNSDSLNESNPNASNIDNCLEMNNGIRLNDTVNVPQQEEHNGNHQASSEHLESNRISQNLPTASGNNSSFFSLRASDRLRTQKSAEDAYRRIELGVTALTRHTSTLSNIWTSGSPRSPLRLLRLMWEDLRREMVRLQRVNIPTATPMHCYTRSTLARCQMLTQNFLSQSSTASSVSNINARNILKEDVNTSISNKDNPNQQDITNNNSEISPSISSSINEPSTSKQTKSFTSNIKGKKTVSKNSARNCSNSSTSTETTDKNRSAPSTSSGINKPTLKPIPRSYLNARHRDSNTFPHRRYFRAHSVWTPALRRRLRTAMVGLVHRLSSTASRLPSRPWPRPRRAGTTSRNRELYCTRDGIRTRARQILSTFFNIMMGCLTTPALETLIIKMLRTLRRALSLTCLLLVPNMRDSNPEPPAPSTEPMPSTSNSAPVDNIPIPVSKQRIEPNESSAPTDSSSETAKKDSITKMWSDHLAIQISAANRNFSTRAKKRKELFNQNRKLKLLHRNTANEPAGPSKATEPLPSNQESNLHHLCARSIPITKYKLHNVNKSSASNRDMQSPRPSTSRDAAELSGPPRLINYNSAIRSFRLRIRSYPLARLRNLPQMGSPMNINFFSDEPAGNAADQPRDESQNSSDTETVPIRRMPRFRFFTIGSGDNPSNPSQENNNENEGNTSTSANRVPLVQINDVPISEFQQNIGARHRREYVRALHINHFEESHNVGGLLDPSPGLVTEASCPVHRIQVWDITNEQMPDISNAEKNIVVEKCKIHNDASIDVSRDGRLIVALLPAHRFRSKRLGIYSLEWNSLGQLLYATTLEQNPVSVALSPCGRHLAVGLGSRRVTLIPSGRSGVMAVIFRLVDDDSNHPLEQRGTLIPVRNLEQLSESNFTSINCLRWAPQPGQGLVYANNTGQLRILS